MRHRLAHLFLFLAAFVLTLLGQASSAPTHVGPTAETLFRRQENGNPLTQTVVTETVQTIETSVLLVLLMGTSILIHPLVVL
jgi:hypothetical protein